MADPAPPAKVEFIDWHRPPLESGDYEITLTQKVSGDGTIPAGTEFTATATLAVAGERFSLAPAEVVEVFPPPGSLGDHSNVLAHVALRRSTLPWERTAEPSGDPATDPPWLALLVLHPGEVPSPQTVTAGDLGMDLETGQDPADKVAVIDVPAELATAIAPTGTELALLTHVRQGTDASGVPVGDELAVVVANRLPAAGGTSVAHLVSMEDRYAGGQFQPGSGGTVRLVTLHSWSFTCIDPDRSFKGLLHGLDAGPMRLAGTQPTAAYATLGFAPVPHLMRDGATRTSVYRGPLLPGQPGGPAPPLPARASDALLRWDPAAEIFDTSYAAAWELGRLLVLSASRVATALFGWKRAHRQSLVEAERALDHLPYGGAGPPAFPAVVAAWFAGLGLLRGVPFPYLVPDPGLLPPESIRFFQVDPAWLACLVDGAFSIGRVTPADQDHDTDHGSPHVSTDGGARSGFLLRSEVVAGWPSLQVDGSASTAIVDEDIPVDERLPILRMDRLAADLLFVMFDGAIGTVDIHQKPEAMHFGLDPEDDGTGWFKELRDADGRPTGSEVRPVTMRTAEASVVEVATLAGDIADQVLDGASMPAGTFALEMIEGAQNVRFTAGG